MWTCIYIKRYLYKENIYVIITYLFCTFSRTSWAKVHPETTRYKSGQKIGSTWVGGILHESEAVYTSLRHSIWVWDSQHNYEALCIILRQSTQIRGILCESKAFYISLRQSAWIWCSLKESETVCMNLRQFTGLWGSLEESNAVFMSLMQCTCV